PIADEALLTKLLDESRNKVPFLLDLAGDNGFMLIIGIGGPLGCVLYKSIDGSSSYPMAVAKGMPSDDDQREVEFLAGGTPTPVLLRKCLPFDVVKQVVIHFFRTGEPSPDVEWVAD